MVELSRLRPETGEHYLDSPVAAECPLHMDIMYVSLATMSKWTQPGRNTNRMLELAMTAQTSLIKTLHSCLLFLFQITQAYGTDGRVGWGVGEGRGGVGVGV